MTLEERKSALIIELKGLSSEKLLSKLEHFIKELKIIEYENSLHPMSEERFNAMIDRAIEEHTDGNVISHQDLINQVKKW